MQRKRAARSRPLVNKAVRLEAELNGPLENSVASFVVSSSELWIVQDNRLGCRIKMISKVEVRIILNECQQRVIQEVVPREAELQLLVLRLTKGEVLKN